MFPFLIALLSALLNLPQSFRLAGLLLNTRIVQLQLGRIDVRFQTPFSLKTWLDEQKRRRSEPREGQVRQPKMDQATLLRALGYEVLAGINDCA